MNNTPSSLICFKNGYSFVNIPVTLSSEGKVTSDDGIKECKVGPLPEFVVGGTVSLTPTNPEKVKIFSLCQAEETVINPPPLKMKQDILDSEGHFSFHGILSENIGTAVRLTCMFQPKNYMYDSFTLNVKSESKILEGTIKAVYKDTQFHEGGSFLILKSFSKGGGEDLVRCSSIVHLETMNQKRKYFEGNCILLITKHGKS